MNTIPYITDTVILSCNLPDVSILTQNPYVDVTLHSSTRTLLSVRLYQADGHATLRDLRPLVEASLKTDHSPLDSFTINCTYGSDDAEKATTTFDVLYCNRLIDAYPSDFFANNFLINASMRRIPTHGFAWLALYALMGESLEYTVAADYLNADGKHRLMTYVAGNIGITATGDDVYSFWVTADSVCAKLGDAGTLVSFSLFCGNRGAAFYIDEALDDVRPFFFRNCFNAEEALWLPSVTTTKASADRSIAVIGGQSQFYDQTNVQEFEVQTAGLTPSECDLAEQLLYSHDVRVPYNGGDTDTDFDSHRAVLITDATVEIKDPAEKPNYVKLTWRYANALPHLAIAAQSSVFTSPFNPIFK